MQEEGIYRKSIKGGFWYMASVFGQKTLNLVAFFILARLLSPADYGIMAVAMLIVTPLNQLTTISFGDALVQRQGSIEKFLKPLFTIEFFRSCILAILIFVFGPMLAAFFHVTEPSSVVLIRVSGFMLVIQALSNPWMIYLFKNLDLKKVFYRDILAQAAYAVGAVGYVLLIGRSAWALFFGLIAQMLVGLIAGYAIYPARPGFSINFRVVVELMGFAKWVYGQEILSVVIAQMDSIFVGRVMAPAELGIYSKAQSLASTATNTVASMISKVGFAAFAKVQDRIDRVQEGFVKSIDILVLSSLPFTLLLLVEGGAVVSLSLGVKWLPIVQPLKIFAFGNLLLTFGGIVAPILSALGRPDINFKTNVIRVLVTFPAMFIGYRFGGMNGLAWAIVITWILLSGYVLLRAKRVMQIHRKLFYPAFGAAIFSCSSVVLADLALRFVLPGSRSHIVDFVVLCGLGLLYFAVLFIYGRWVKKSPVHTAFSVLRELRIPLGVSASSLRQE